MKTSSVDQIIIDLLNHKLYHFTSQNIVDQIKSGYPPSIGHCVPFRGTLVTGENFCL